MKHYPTRKGAASVRSFFAREFLALLLYITRLWPILLLVILGIFIATLRLLFLSCKSVEVINPILSLPEATEPSIPGESDVHLMGYWVIQNRISQILYRQFPNARWVWENPRARQDILQGNRVFILLNQAGGYRRGEVMIRNLQVMDIVFDEISKSNSQISGKQKEEQPSNQEQKIDDKLLDEEEIPEDYGLMAFEWVNTHVMDLNERVNKAIACLQSNILISSQELPVEASWPDICWELERNDLFGASCQDDGILIEFER